MTDTQAALGWALGIAAPAALVARAYFLARRPGWLPRGAAALLYAFSSLWLLNTLFALAGQAGSVSQGAVNYSHGLSLFVALALSAELLSIGFGLRWLRDAVLRRRARQSVR